MHPSIQVKSTVSHYNISIDRKALNKSALLRFVKLLRLETLANSANLPKEIEPIGDQIKRDWWKKNKKNFLKRA
jgi:hypothetical protein